MLHAILPLKPAAPMRTGIQTSKADVLDSLDARAPFVCTDEVYTKHWAGQVQEGGMLRLSMSAPSLTRREGRIVLKWTFLHRQSSAHNWPGYVKLRLPCPGGLERTLIEKKRIGAATARMSEDIVDADIAKIHEASSMLIEAFSFGWLPEIKSEALRVLIDSCDGVDDAVARAVRAGRSLQRSLDLDREALEEKIVAEINALADGTPLMLRSGLHGRQWRLGVKRGALPARTALHAAIASPEVLRSPALKAHGFSLHNVLKLDAAARQALQTCPAAARFRLGSKTMREEQLHDTKPFHESFHDPDVLKAARKGPKIWMQTSRDTEGRVVFCRGLRPVHQRPREAILPDGYGPSFPHHPKAERCQIHRLTVTSAWGVSSVRPDDFAIIAGILCVSQKARDVLEQFETGAQFKPVQLFEMDNKTEIPGPWFQMIMGAPIRAVRTDRLSADLTRNLMYRTILPYEIEINAAAVSQADLWWDDRLERQALFMSARLKSALTKAGIRLALALKPCLPD